MNTLSNGYTQKPSISKETVTTFQVLESDNLPGSMGVVLFGSMDFERVMQPRHHSIVEYSSADRDHTSHKIIMGIYLDRILHIAIKNTHVCKVMLLQKSHEALLNGLMVLVV